jgi:hypothetical protein
MTDNQSNRNSYVRPRSTERRASSRHAFTASALVIEPRTHARMSARTSDLDHMGCYIDTMNPFSEGTTVTLRLAKDNQTFNVLAKVVYAHAGMGMGLTFNNPDPEQVRVLDEWLGKTTRSFPEEQPAPEPRFSDRFLSVSRAYEQAPHDVLRYLILMLVQKEILLVEEGQALLEKLVNQPSRN